MSGLKAVSGLKADQLPNLNPRNPGEPIIASGIINGAKATFDASGAVDATNLSGWANGGG